MRALLLLAIMAACATHEPVTDACRAVDAKVYRSVEALPYGENQQGPVLHAWYLDLGGGAVDWRHDDTIHDQGTYTCSGLAIHAVLAGETVDATLDAATGALTWAGHDYLACSDRAQCRHDAGWQ